MRTLERTHENTHEKKQPILVRLSAVAASLGLIGIGGIAMAPAASACTINPTATCESNYEPGTEQEVRDSANCFVSGAAGGIGGIYGALGAYGACQINNIIG